MKITQKELVTFAESITSALEEIATKIGAVEDIISGDKEVEEVADENEDVEIEEDVEDDVDEDVDTEVEDDEEEVADEDEEVVADETPAENFSERLKNVKNFLNM